MKNLLLIAVSVFLSITVIAQNPAEGFKNYMKDKKPVLNEEENYTTIVILNPKDLKDKIVLGSIMLDDKYYLSAMNGEFSTYHITPGKHKVTLLSGVPETIKLKNELAKVLENCRTTKCVMDLKKKDAWAFAVRNHKMIGSSKQEAMKWLSTHKPDNIIDNDIMIYYANLKDKEFVVTRKWENHQINKDFPEGTKVERKEMEGAYGKSILGVDYITYEKDFEPGQIYYFYVVNRDYVCGPILRETDYGKSKELKFKKMVKPGYEYWGKVKKL